MPTAIRTPRVNNNDDAVRLASVPIEIGSHVRAGDPVADIETDKAVFTVESSVEGYLLGVNGKPGDTLEVGSVLAWIGATADEAVAEEPAAAGPSEEAGEEPTLKALLLLRAHGLAAGDVPHTGRLTAADVERYAAGRVQTRAGAAPAASWTPPEAPGHIEAFTAEQRGMARTVAWHRDEAVPGYIEIAYDPQPWDAYAAEFQKTHGLLLSPLLPLMAYRLAKLAAESPRINATAGPAGAYLYHQVNLGFTVQAGASLYLVVVRDAGARSEADFVSELSEAQRSAIKHALKAEQTAGATIGFTSMARWNVTRHIPVLAPQTALMAAHSANINGSAQFGASYDHRLLTGFDVVQVLRALSSPSATIGG
jgi:pyruvate/2-oxoglutarate dehydrogenase complex dihydrolipoamide acyltransferase (E2) component